jgi:hypothetical protein
LFLFSRRAGLPVEFNCGVMKLDRHLEGHAWLTLNGTDWFIRIYRGQPQSRSLP